MHMHYLAVLDRLLSQERAQLFRLWGQGLKTLQQGIALRGDFIVVEKNNAFII